MNRILKNKEIIITQNFSNNHPAIDVVGDEYTLDHVITHSSGTVVMVQTGKKNNKGSTGNESYGNFIKIEHENGFYTLYAHLKYVDVKLGEYVEKGQVIGYMGDSGNAYGKHLHFEVWKNNTRLNPIPYLNKDLENKINYYPKYNGKSNSIVDALKSLNINSSFNNRTKIAQNNNISNYKGTSTQNTKLLNLLKQGKLKKS